MKRFHHVTISVFDKEGDQPLAALDALLPFPAERFFIDGQKVWIEKTRARYSIDKERAHLDVQQAKGFDSDIMVYTLFFEKSAHSNRIFETIIEKIPEEQRKGLKGELMLHVDEHGHFFMRIDKPKLEAGSIELTTGGDCFRFDFALAAYPKNAKTIHERVKRLMEEL